MLLPLTALFGGIILLVVSADRFVVGASNASRLLGLPPLLVGMLVIGFGSSMPEMVISAISAVDGSPGLALGNAFGSNIANIALILGVTALISPIAVKSTVLHRELPLLIGTTLFATLLLLDGEFSRLDGVVLVALFCAVMGWSIREGMGNESGQDALAEEVKANFELQQMSMTAAMVQLVGGLIFLTLASRILVWAGVEIATSFGISDLVIGLTIVAVGTSLPELASSIAAVRKNEHDLALGNVIGSNIFNTTIVVGIAGTISPMVLDEAMLTRDVPVLLFLTGTLFVMCWGFRGEGRIERWEAAALLTAYAAYNGWLLKTTFG